METFLAGLDPVWVYVVVGILTFGESAAFLGLLFPGEVGLVAAAALGTAVGVDPISLAAVAAVCATAGGLVGYRIGGRYGPDLIRRPAIAKRLGARWEQLQPVMRGPRGDVVVAVARFNQVTRAIAPALAGLVGMQPLRFVVANTVGAAVWAATFVALGHFAAEFWASASRWVHLGGAAIIVAYVAATLVARARRA